LIWLTAASSVAQGLDHCNRCGDCCRFPCLIGSEDEVRALADRHEMGVRDFAAHYLRFRVGDSIQVTPRKEGEFCVFYKDGCTVHDIKPAGGRDFECWTPERTAADRAQRFSWTPERLKTFLEAA
jgi:Fe-S-cluster containining protein